MNIEQERNRLDNLGVNVNQIHIIKDLIAYCNFQDPYGNKLSLYQML